MRERGILFSSAMVRALLAGTKTQTRRAARFARGPEPHPQDERLQIVTVGSRGEQFWLNSQPDHLHHISRACPYGQPGDRLWVRETMVASQYRCHLSYAADGADCIADEDSDAYAELWGRRVRCGENGAEAGKVPSIHMPRWASRITLEITAVRVERLQDIGEADAKAEGCRKPMPVCEDDDCSYRADYERLWESINGPGSWDANPWVWVLEFKRVTP